MNQWWQYWPSYFTPEDCDNLLKSGEAIEPVPAVVGHGSGEYFEDRNLRRSMVRWLPPTDKRFLMLYKSLDLLFQEANRIAFGFSVTGFREVQLAEYSERDSGTYGWHHDTEWTSKHLIRRKLSMAVQLSSSEDYSGGDLEFREDQCGETPDPQELRKQGTIIVFPAFLEHRVTPVTAGTRRSLVTWLEGPYFQ
jgi:PKHD-type hydroxylase